MPVAAVTVTAAEDCCWVCERDAAAARVMRLPTRVAARALAGIGGGGGIEPSVPLALAEREARAGRGGAAVRAEGFAAGFAAEPGAPKAVTVTEFSIWEVA
jgi:hypothetical protein